MERFSFEFEKILTQARAIVKAEVSAQQIVVVETSKSHIYHFANHDVMSGVRTDEETFVKTLIEREDTEIRYAVCLWNDFQLDVPSLHFRKLLLKINPANAETLFLLNGGEGLTAKALKAMLPPRP